MSSLWHLRTLCCFHGRAPAFPVRVEKATSVMAAASFVTMPRALATISDLVRVGGGRRQVRAWTVERTSAKHCLRVFTASIAAVTFHAGIDAQRWVEAGALPIHFGGLMLEDFA